MATITYIIRQMLMELQTASSGINFSNILRAAFWYDMTITHSFLHFWLRCVFLVNRNWQKRSVRKMQLKLTAGLKEINQNDCSKKLDRFSEI